jgi:hypothetical protein
MSMSKGACLHRIFIIYKPQRMTGLKIICCTFFLLPSEKHGVIPEESVLTSPKLPYPKSSKRVIDNS